MSASYNAVDIQRSTYKLWLDVRRGLKELPEYRGRNTVIPNAAGQIERTKVADRLEIELYGWIKGDDWSEYWTLVKELLALFDPGAPAETLSVDLEDGTTATIDCKPLSVVPEGNEAIGAAQYFSVLLEATDPPEWAFA